MIQRISEKRLMGPQDVQPSRDDFAVIGVFNPGAIKIKNEIVLLVRVAERPCESRQGFVGLPRFELDGTITIDWVPDHELEQVDPRVVRCKTSGCLRLTSISHLRVFRCSDAGVEDGTPGPVLLPASPMEEFGIEDPRITEIDGKYWITYVAVSRHGAATALASSGDMMTFQRHGVVFCAENKDVVLFSHQLRGQYVALHRPNPHAHFSPPEIWLARSPDLLHWGEHECLLRGTRPWENDRVGAGPPPVLLSEGWLAIYHGCQRAERAGEVGVYSAGAVLLDRERPSRILGRTDEPMMQPTADHERFGFVDDVVFPTALLARDDTLTVYYGAADTCVGAVEFSLNELLAALH